jgi:hypothetical protein
MKLNHDADSMAGALGISEERHRYIHGLVWWAIVYNHHLKETLYGGVSREEIPKNLTRKSGIVEFIFNDLESEAERLLGIYDYQKVDALTDNDEMAKMGLNLCAMKAEVFDWKKEPFIEYFCNKLMEAEAL